MEINVATAGTFQVYVGRKVGHKITLVFQILCDTLWVGVWTHKHLLRRSLGDPNTYSQGIWRILEDQGKYELDRIPPPTPMMLARGLNELSLEFFVKNGNMFGCLRTGLGDPPMAGISWWVYQNRSYGSSGGSLPNLRSFVNLWSHIDFICFGVGTSEIEGKYFIVKLLGNNRIIKPWKSTTIERYGGSFSIMISPYYWKIVVRKPSEQK